MSVDIVGILTAGTVLINLFLTILIVMKTPRNNSLIAASLFTGLLTAWSTTRFLYRISGLPFQIQSDMFYLDFFLAPLGSYAFVVFCSYFPENKSYLQKWLLIILGGATLLISLIASSTRFVIKLVIETPYGINYQRGPLDWAYAIYTLLLLLLGCYLIIRKLKNASTHVQTQLKFLIVGSLCTTILLAIPSLILWRSLNETLANTQLVSRILPDISNAGTIIISCTIAWVLLKFKTYEIQIILGKLVFWSGIGIFFFTVFYVVSLVELSLFESILQPNVLILNFFLAFVTAVMFATYEKGLRQFVEKNFLRYAYDPQEVVRTLTIDLSQTTEISKSIHTFFDTLSAATTVKTCGFIIHQASNQEWLKEEWVGIQMEQKDQLIQEEALNDLLFYGAGEGVTFIQTKNLQTPSLKINLAKEHIYLAAHIQQDDFNAVLLIGNKRKKGPLTEDDTYVIEHGLYALLHRIKEIQWQ